MAEGDNKEIKDLWPLIQETSVECLNQDSAHTVDHCFKQVQLPRALSRTRHKRVLCARSCVVAGHAAALACMCGFVMLQHP